MHAPLCYCSWWEPSPCDRLSLSATSVFEIAASLIAAAVQSPSYNGDGFPCFAGGASPASPFAVNWLAEVKEKNWFIVKVLFDSSLFLPLSKWSHQHFHSLEILGCCAATMIMFVIDLTAGLLYWFVYSCTECWQIVKGAPKPQCNNNKTSTFAIFTTI